MASLSSTGRVMLIPQKRTSGVPLHTLLVRRLFRAESLLSRIINGRERRPSFEEIREVC